MAQTGVNSSPIFLIISPRHINFTPTGASLSSALRNGGKSMEISKEAPVTTSHDADTLDLSRISFSDFQKVHMHMGTVLTAELNQKARNPAYVLTIDFGQTHGIKTTSAQLVANYAPEDLIGRQVIAVLNFPSKDVAGVCSEVLVLAAVCPSAGTVLLAPLTKVADGTRVV